MSIPAIKFEALSTNPECFSKNLKCSAWNWKCYQNIQGTKYKVQSTYHEILKWHEMRMNKGASNIKWKRASKYKSKGKN